jgi:hypothetical protein
VQGLKEQCYVLLFTCAVKGFIKCTIVGHDGQCHWPFERDNIYVLLLLVLCVIQRLRLLSVNNISGTLPCELGRLTALTFLYGCVLRCEVIRMQEFGLQQPYRHCAKRHGAHVFYQYLVCVNVGSNPESCRRLGASSLNGTLPTVLGSLHKLTDLCATSCIRLRHISSLM